MSKKTVDIKEGDVIVIADSDYVLIKKSDLKEYIKAKNNLTYIQKLERAFKNIDEGKVSKHDLIEVD